MPKKQPTMAAAVYCFDSRGGSGFNFRRTARHPETGEILATIEFAPGVPTLVPGELREMFAGELDRFGTTIRRAEVPVAAWAPMLAEYCDERRDTEIERLRRIVGNMRVALMTAGWASEDIDAAIEGRQPLPATTEV